MKNLGKVRRIIAYFRPHRAKYFLGLFFLFLTSITALIFPKLIGDMIDTAEQAMLSDIDRVAIGLLILFVAQAVFSFFRIYLFVSVTENVLSDLRKDTYSRLIRLPMNFFSTNRVGELNSRIGTDINMLSDHLYYGDGGVPSPNNADYWRNCFTGIHLVTTHCNDALRGACGGRIRCNLWAKDSYDLQRNPGSDCSFQRNCRRNPRWNFKCESLC